MSIFDANRMNGADGLGGCWLDRYADAIGLDPRGIVPAGGIAAPPDALQLDAIGAAVGPLPANGLAGRFDTPMDPHAAFWTLVGRPAGTASADAADPTDAATRQYQQLAVEAARRELALGVREDQGNDRSERIDLYCRSLRRPTGQAWCGMFTGFTFLQAGMRHAGRFVSPPDARHFFLYQDGRGNEADLATHRQQGDLRQFFVLDGSSGQDYFRSHRRQYANFELGRNTYSYQNLPIRAGDVVTFYRPNGRAKNHIGVVESYDPATGQLVTIEGNASNQVRRKTYDLTDPRVREVFMGFGRPARGDFPPGPPAPALA